MKAELLTEYDHNRESLAHLGERLQALLQTLLAEHGIRLHTLSHRLKDRQSLQRKLARPDKTYSELWDVTDLVGLRIVTYFEDEVDAVAQLIETHLRVDWDNSVDKRQVLGARSFGYRSVHYICRCDHSLWKSAPAPAQLRCEIQLRTVLQHAWAEIEHDLGYKNPAGLPSRQQRRISQLAALLELADEEFQELRQGLDRYKQDVSERVRTGQAQALDQVSILSLLQEPEVLALDLAIAQQLTKPLGESPYFPEYLLGVLHRCGLSTVDAVQQLAAASTARVAALLPRYFEFAHAAFGLDLQNLSEIEQGYSLFFLALVSVMDSEVPRLSKVERFAQLFREMDRQEERQAQRLAGQLVDVLGRAATAPPEDLFV